MSMQPICPVCGVAHEPRPCPSPDVSPRPPDTPAVPMLYTLVAALFVRADSIYMTLPGVDCYDEARDARTWPGGCPIVAHPPCRTWSKLRKCASRAPIDEHELAPWAIDQVRRWGGVLEHPQGSTLFRECGCAVPRGLPDEWGGVTLEVEQFHWGHKARKRTLLYVVGTLDFPALPQRAGRPTHVVSSGYGVRSKPGHSHRSALPEITKREREATPPAFAAWLVELARRCKKAQGGPPMTAPLPFRRPT